ncbi:MAG: hypothetical protein ACRBN8_27425 [Nannocystales bacterium]
MNPEAWLSEHAVHGDAVLSWVNPDHRGYAYPEAAGLLLRWFALQGIPAPRDVTTRLAIQVDEGRVGRDGLVYAFDTAVALAGLETLDEHEDPRWTEARRRLTTTPVVHPAAPPRWSSVAGPHMLKLAVGCAARAQRGWSTPTLDRLADVRVQQDATGRLRTPPHEPTYVHAHAYACEGLLALRALDVPAPVDIDGAIEFLCRVQREDGGIPAWSDGGPSRADGTAQAIRLWVLHDPEGHRGSIDRGLAFLDSLTDEQGAVRYEPDSADRNTWCTLFAAQARAWASGAPARVEDLL